jgi:TPR repeat protein
VALLLLGALPWVGPILGSDARAAEIPRASSERDWAGKPLDSVLAAARQGQGGAMVELYRRYQDGRGVDADAAQAVGWLTQAAEAGNGAAQAYLGYHNESLLKWDPVSESSPSNNMPVAVEWYRRSAKQGHAGGEYHLGLCYLEGKGVAQDEERGLELIRQSADQNHAYALFQLARLYAEGVGVPRGEQERPVKLLARAATLEHPQALAALAARYRQGQGVGRDLVRAAALQCRYSIARGLGRALRDSMSKALRSATAPADPETAAALLFWRAIQQGEADAPLQIGRMYTEGKDVPQDPTRAWCWLTISARLGSADAEAAAAKVQSAMSPQEQADARKLLPGFVEELDKLRAATR